MKLKPLKIQRLFKLNGSLNQRDSSYKERTVQANQAAQRFASHSPSIFEYASNFYICQADQLEKLSDIL